MIRLINGLLSGILGLFGATLPGVRSVFKKELIQLLRDHYLVAFIVTLPIIQLLVTGLAIQKDLKHIELAVCNYDKRNASVELLKRLESSGIFLISDRSMVASEAQLSHVVRQGRFRAGLVIPPDYSNDLLSGGDHATVSMVVDGTNGTIAKTIVNAAGAIVAHTAREWAGSQIPASLSSGGSVGSSDTGLPIQLNTKVLYNPEMKSSFFLIPAILAIIMHMMTILFTSFSIVRERETGTLEQLMVTPIRVSDLMIGKVLPYLAIGFFDMILTLGVMIWFFQIAVTGSFWFLCVASIIFILTSLGMGLLISTSCKSQVQAVQLTLALLLPSLLLSGFVFPIEPMPWLVKGISYALPLTYYLEVIRGVVIKGVGFAELWPQTGILTVSAIVVMALSVVRFKKHVA